MRLMHAALFMLFLLPIASAYELNGTIDVGALGFTEIVTTKSIGFNITIKNVGNETFPKSNVNVTILDPRRQQIEEGYSFRYELPELVANQTHFYENYIEDEKGISLPRGFKVPIPGTWGIQLKIYPLPSDAPTWIRCETTRSYEGICAKLFYVKDYGAYLVEQSNLKAEQSDLKVNNALKELSIALYFLALLTFLSNRDFRRIVKEWKDIIGTLSLLTIGVYFIALSGWLSLLSGIIWIIFALIVPLKRIAPIRRIYEKWSLTFFISELVLYLMFIYASVMIASAILFNEINYLSGILVVLFVCAGLAFFYLADEDLVEYNILYQLGALKESFVSKLRTLKTKRK